MKDYILFAALLCSFVLGVAFVFLSGQYAMTHQMMNCECEK